MLNAIKVLFSKLTNTRDANFERFLVFNFRSEIPCFSLQYSFLDIKNVNFLQKFQIFGDTLKLTFISDFRKFVMGLALFCDEVDQKNWWHFDFYPNAQLFPVEQIDMTIFPKIVPPYYIA